MLPLLEPVLTEVDRLAEVNKLATHLADGSVALRDVAARVLQKQRGTDRLLLFVDQWEELYTLCCPEEETRRAFMVQLLEAAGAGSVRVVLTMRGDFFGRALADRALSDQLQDAVVNIGPMTRDELAETILKPAEAVGLSFEAGLAETILDDVGREPGNLPLLEFLLEALWKERRGPLLHYDAYHRLGRVPGAIAHRAEEVFERELSEAERQAAQRLLIRMVRPGEGVEDTRQRAAMPEADPVAEATIRKLADARLVVTERDAATGRETVEVAHEALIRGWQRLRGWVDQDRDFLRTRERIAAQARRWDDDGGPPDRLLPPGRPLAEGEDLLAKRRADLDADLIAYIEASAAAARAEEEATRATQRRRIRFARLIAAAMTALALVAIADGVVAWWQREQANRNADEAHLNAEEAQHNAETAQRDGSRALASLAEAEVERGSPATATRLGLAALPMRLDSPDRAYAPAAEGALLYSVQHLRERRRFLHEGVVSSVAFSPDGRTLATGSDDYTAWLWEVATGKEIGVLRHSAVVSSTAFSPDGRTVVTGSWDATARLWEVASGKEIAILRGHEDSVSSVVFSADGRMLATGSWDNTARLWEVASGKEIGVLSGHEVRCRPSPSAPTGACSPPAQDNTARLWEVASGKEIGVVRGHEHVLGNSAIVSSVASSPNGLLLTVLGYAIAQVWDMASRREIATLRGHEGAVTSVAFSPDGRTAVTGSLDNTARLWEVASGREIALLGHESWVYSVALSPDGRTVATGSFDGIAQLWEAATGREIMTLRGHEDYVQSVAFSPDGRTLATGSPDMTARLWEVATGKEIAVLRHEGGVKSVAFSPDGRTLATGSDDNTARLWPVGQRLIDLACARVHDLPLSEWDKQRFGIEKEWCTPEVSGELRAKLGLDKSEESVAAAPP